MADEPKPEPKPEPKDAQANEAPSSAALSPAPTVVAGDNKTKPDPNSRVQAEPLADGTVPTVLTPGQTHHSVAKGKASLTSVYRKADIMTTLFTFAGAVVAGAIIIGGYIFFTGNKTKAPTSTPKVTNLSQSDLSKLQTFFQGNSAGSPTEVLTISSSSLFKNRVAVGSDLKVTGGVSVDGLTQLGDLEVDKTATLGIVNTKGQLTVNGPLTVQSAALFNAGATYKGNISATGNGSFGGSLSAASLNVQTLSVTNQLNIDGHLNIGGSTPSVSPESGAGPGATASVIGNDTSGTISFSTTSVPNNSNNGGGLVRVTFRNSFPTAPAIIISSNGRNGAVLQPYVTKTANWFIISGATDARSSTSYSFDYWVVQ